MTTVQTVKTQYATSAEGVKYAYRRLGPSSRTPLLFLHHFRGTMDTWDPLLIDTFLLQDRPVILFDNAGVGHSTGSVATSMIEAAAHVVTFLSLISVKQVDVLGYSLGGIYAPLIHLNGPKGLVRKLILGGTTVTYGEGLLPGMSPHDPKVQEYATSGTISEETFLYIFFKPTPTSTAAGKAWWARTHTRTPATSGEPIAPYVSENYTDAGAAMMAQVGSMQRANDPEFVSEGTYDRMGEIDIPVLVANGFEDVMVPTMNSFVMSQKIPKAWLVTYPDAGHGFLFQYAREFGKLAGEFLDSWGGEGEGEGKEELNVNVDAWRYRQM